MLATLLWQFEIVPAPAMQPITPRVHNFEEGNAEDEGYPPLNFNTDMMCKPSKPTCLIENLPTHRSSEPSMPTNDNDAECDELEESGRLIESL